MFRKSSGRFHSWLTRIGEALDDVLGDPSIDVHSHPHRFPLRWKYGRRGGSVPPRPAHCTSPIHAAGARGLDATPR
jgi:hypothetical protein